MRAIWILLGTAGCGFQISSGSTPPIDDAAAIDSLVDTGDDAADDGAIEIDAATDAAIDGSIAMDAGIDAPPNPCGVSPGQVVVVSPTTDWMISTNGTSGWTATTLPSTNWPCDNCSRFFRATVCGSPTSVKFRFSSDNRARMRVNTTVAYAPFWMAGYCTDQPCCSRCCDSSTNCTTNLSNEVTLSASDLALFTQGSNTVTWEVAEEDGGSGFHTLMSITY